MEIIEAIRSRRCIRSFKPDPVPRKVLEELLDACRWAPSYRNMQSWEFAILGGKVMEEAKARIAAKVKEKAAEAPDLASLKLSDPYLRRSVELRDSIDTYQFPPGTEKLDEKRFEYWVKGGRFHDAPNAIIVYIDKALAHWGICDAGIVCQTIALAALAHGLGTCPVVRPTFWPNILREILGIPESSVIVMAICIGYPDLSARVNGYERHREPLRAFAHWHGL